MRHVPASAVAASGPATPQTPLTAPQTPSATAQTPRDAIALPGASPHHPSRPQAMATLRGLGGDALRQWPDPALAHGWTALLQ